MERSCENCEYGVEIYKDVNFDSNTAKTCVLCHRYPPQSAKMPMVKKIVEVFFSWPVVRKTHWCGEYKPKHKE